MLFTHQRLKLFTPTGKLRRCLIFMRRLFSSLVEHPGCRFSTFPFPGSRNHGRRRHFHVQRFGAENQTYIFCTDRQRFIFYVEAGIKTTNKGKQRQAYRIQHCRLARAIRCNQNRNVLIKSNIELSKATKVKQ
ncbi:hypothetical protein NGUA07_00217 [Salmonella enterica]|nr:hypothetical protein NGUA07_00217 [Salmonella enterica]